jgi:hypothetical protein
MPEGLRQRRRQGVSEHPPGEPQYQLAIRDERVLSPSIRFKEIFVVFV